MEMHK